MRSTCTLNTRDWYGRACQSICYSANWLRWVLVLGAVLIVLAPGAAMADATLSLTQIRSSDTLPLARPRWPQPLDKHQVFYLQRDMNRNTIVYTAHFGADGMLKSPPINAYWRRFAEEGQTKPLKTVEKLLAYGVKARKNHAGKDSWNVDFVALSALKAELRQSGPFRADLWASINNREYKLIYGFLDLDRSGFITKVERLHLYTFDPVTEKYVTHIINVSGGDIRE